MKKHGLKGPHALYLVTLLEHEEGLTAGELCSACGKDKADISRAISLLEDRGLVAKDGTGIYRTKIKLTDKGREMAGMIGETAKRFVEYVGQGISDEDRSNFYFALKVIEENLRDVVENGIPAEEDS